MALGVILIAQCLIFLLFVLIYVPVSGHAALAETRSFSVPPPNTTDVRWILQLMAIAALWLSLCISVHSVII